MEKESYALATISVNFETLEQRQGDYNICGDCVCVRVVFAVSLLAT